MSNDVVELCSDDDDGSPRTASQQPKRFVSAPPAPDENCAPNLLHSASPRRVRQRSGVPLTGAHLALQGLSGPHAGAVFVLEGSVAVGRGVHDAGRAASDPLVLADREVSRAHLRIARGAAGRWALEDLGSLNGTLVNGERVAAAERAGGGLCALSEGDRIEVGDCAFAARACACAHCLAPREGAGLGPPARECAVCGEDLSALALLDRELHANACLDDRQAAACARRLLRADCAAIADCDGARGKAALCVVCAVDLSAFSAREQVVHVNNCLDEAPLDGAARSAARPVAASAAKERQGAGRRLRGGRKREAPGGAVPKGARASVLAGSVGGSMAQVRKRIRLVDARIAQLQRYREQLVAFAESAERVDAALGEEDSGAEASAAVATALRCQRFDVSLSSGSSVGSACSGASAALPDAAQRSGEPPVAAPDAASAAASVPAAVGEDQRHRHATLWAATAACSAESLARPVGTGADAPQFLTAVLRGATEPGGRENAERGNAGSEGSQGGCAAAVAALDDAALRRCLAELGMAAGSRLYMERELARVWAAVGADKGRAGDTPAVHVRAASAAEKEEALSLAMCAAITRTLRNERLYEDILLNKCVPLAEVQRALAAEGVKVPRKKLMGFLDSHGVTYKT